MKNYSSGLTSNEVGLLLSLIECVSYSSREDDCRVVLVKCAECKKTFEEELQVTVGKIKTGLDFLCLACDRDADEPAFWGVRFAMLWK